jgi:hypothetical protein
VAWPGLAWLGYVTDSRFLSKQIHNPNAPDTCPCAQLAGLGHLYTFAHVVSQGTKEIHHMLFVDFIELVELRDHLVRF